MAKSLLQITANYDNPYEAAHQLLQGNPFYNSNDWAKMSREGRLNSYIQLLDDTRLLNKSFDELSQEYGFELLSAENTEERIAAIANELSSDRTNTEFERQERFFNDQTGKYETRKFNMSDYDYTKYLLQQKTAELKAIKDAEEAQERKDSSNGFVRFLADIPGALGEVGLGLMEFTDNTISLFEGVYDGITAMNQGKDFSEGFREAFNTNEWGGADWRLFDNLGWKKSITEWEAAYTDLRDVNGNYTNVGKYIGGVAYSLGQALPSMGLNLVTGGIAGSASLAAEVMSKASTLLYFTGLSAGTMHELASDPNFATVPTERLILNAAVKGTLEWAMTKLTAAAFGASNMDRLTFGWRGDNIGKVGTLAAFQTIAKDFVKEGLEEVLQEFSGYVVDTYMAHLNSEFGDASQWNFQTLCDAFVLGGLSTIGGNIISILKTGAKDFYNKRTKGIYKPTTNIFASWSFDNIMRNMSNDYNDIINNKRMSNDDKLTAAGQMYATFRTLSSLYGEIGDIRFANAMDMLNQMAVENELANMPNAEKQAVAIMSSLEQLGYDYSQKAKIEAELKKAKITKINSTIDKNIASDADSITDIIDATDISDSAKAAVINAVSELFNFDSSIDRVVLTDDGNTVVALNNDLFVPIKYTTNADGTILLNTVAEQQLVNNTIASTVLKQPLEAISNIFKTVTGRDNVELEEVVYNLYFNGTFQQTLLGVANRELYQVITHLEQTANAAVSNDVKDKLYIEKIKKAMTQLKIYVTDYLILQQNAEFESLKFLTDKQKKRIHELRWSRDLANRVIRGDTLSSNDKQLITNRINSMPAKQDIKTSVLNNIFSKDTDARKSALATLERYYRDVFNSPYNGTTYLPATSVKNQLFNVFLQSLGLKINTLMTPVIEGPLYESIRQRFNEVTPETTLQYYQEQFTQFSNNTYSFSYKNGKIIITEVAPTVQTDFNNVLTNEAKLSDYTWRTNERSNITIKSGGERLIAKFLNNDLDKVSRANLTVNDIIFNPSFLSKTTQENISKMQGGLTPLNTFVYLRSKLLSDTGAMSIVVTNDGHFVLADVKPMIAVLSNPDISRFTIDKTPKIQNLVKPDYLQGRLGDIVVEFGKDTYYDVNQNKIVIDKVAASDPYYFRFAFLHEFQHAIQIENNLNGGLDYDWLRNANLSKTKKNAIITDIRKHYPELFKDIKRNSDAELDLAQKIIYYQSGELQAYGLETMQDINDFYPTIVNTDVNGTVITMPWGTAYDLNNRRMNLRHHGLELVSPSEYQEFLDAYNKHIDKSFTFGDMSYMNYKNMYEQLLQDIPEIKAWIRLGNDTVVSPLGTIYTAEKVLHENNLKQKLLDAITPAVRKRMFNIFRLKVAPEIDYDTFIDMDIPYTRIQTVLDESSAPFVSITLGPISNLDTLGAMFDKVTDRYILTGTVKLKDLLGLIPSQENEGLISPKLLNEISDKWTGQFVNNYADEYGVYNLRKLGTDEIIQMPVNKMSMAKQPGGKRYVSNKEAEQSNLKYFIKKYVPIQLSPAAQDFVKSATDFAQLEPELADMIKSGKLTQSKVFEYLRTADDINDYTFAQINNAFFNNKHIQNFKQLQYMLEIDLADYYALRTILRYIYKDGDNADFIFKPASHAAVQKLIERIKQDSASKKVFDDIRLRYDTNKGEQLYINRDAMRVAFMKYFDGSIESVAHVAAMAKILARSGFKYAGDMQTVSTDETVKGTTKTRLDYIDEELADDAFSDLSDMTDAELINDIVTYKFSKLIDELKSATKSEIMEKQYYIREDIETWSRADLEDAAAKIQLEQLSGNTLLDAAMGPDSNKLIRPAGKVNANITRIVSKIRANLSAKELRLLTEHKSDIFNADGTIKQELRKEGDKLVTREQLRDLEDKLKDIWKDVRNGVYSSKRNIDLNEQLKHTREKLEKERAKKATAKGLFNKVLIIDGTSYQVDSTMNAPKVLQQMLDTEFTDFSRTITKFITDPTEIHMKISYDQFMEQNAERLDNLTSTDISNIIDFYTHAVIHTDLSEANVRKFDSFKLFILGYIYKQAINGTYSLSNTDIAKIKMLMQETVGGAATVFNSWQSVLKQIDPNKKIIQSIAKRSGIEFDDTDISAVSAAINTKDINKINLAMEQLYQTGLQKLANIRNAQAATTKGKLDQIFVKLQKFQAMMMLSSPGTAIRNLSSNVAVNIGDSISSWLGKATFGALSKVTGKSFHKEGQYVLTGTQTGLKTFVTPGWREVRVKQKDGSYKLVKKRSLVISGKIKVDTPVARFVKTNFIDNDLINFISDGVSKYDVRKYNAKSKKTGADAITDLIVNSVVTRIFNENQFSTKTLNRMSSFIFKMLSDDPFVNTRALSYFGKMLTEDGTDLSNGITTEIANTFAEAYTRAAWDYMHKANFFTKMESALRDKVGGAGFFMYKQLLPFAAASWNWFIEGLNYTPIGLIKGIVQMAKLEDIITDIENKRAKGEKLPSSRFTEYIAKRNIGKGIIGSIALAAGMLLWAFGGAKIDEKDDKIKLSVGDVTVDISNLFGTQGIFLGIALMNPRKGNAYKAITDVISTLFEDSTITDLFNTFRYSESIGEFFASQPSQMLSMYIPNALKAFNKLLYNHNVKYGSGILGQFERLAIQAVPGLAYKWPKKVDIYTGEVQTKYSVPFLLELVNTMSPIKIGSYKVSDLEKLSYTWSYINDDGKQVTFRKTNLTGDYDDIGKLSENDTEILNIKYGELNNKFLTEFIDNKRKYKVQLEDGTYTELYYKNMTDKQKIAVANRITTNTAKYSKIYVWTSNGGKYYATDSEYIELKKLGITKGVYKKVGNKDGFVK